MAIVPTDISQDYILKSISGSLIREEHVYSTSTTSVTGKIISFTGNFGLLNISNGEILRISDGSVTVDYEIVHTSGGGEGGDGLNATSSIHIGGGSNRSAQFVADEFVLKINASALDVTATDNGGGSEAASFTLVPGAGKTLTITEDPTPGNGVFGGSAGFCVISDSGGTTTTTKHRVAPMRLFENGAPNIRGQSAENCYKTFVGQRKS